MASVCFDFEVEGEEDVSDLFDDCGEEETGPGDWLKDPELLSSV